MVPNGPAVWLLQVLHCLWPVSISRKTIPTLKATLVWLETFLATVLWGHDSKTTPSRGLFQNFLHPWLVCHLEIIVSLGQFSQLKYLRTEEVRKEMGPEDFQCNLLHRKKHPKCPVICGIATVSTGIKMCNHFNICNHLML